MKRYIQHRNRIVQELEKEKQKQLAEMQKAETEAKNAKARFEILEEIKQAMLSAKENMPNWLRWEDVPVHYAEIALNNGLISPSDERKKVLWTQAKEEVKKSLKGQILNNQVPAMQKIKAKEILKKIEAGETSDLNQMATRIYSKLLIWDYVGI
jgi:hypothetical protein